MIRPLMKNNKFKKALFISIFIMFFLRILLAFITIYTSVTTINVPKLFRQYEVNVHQYTAKQNCINIKVTYDKSNDQTIFDLAAKSLKKQKSEKCIRDAVYFLESLINEKNSYIDEKLSKSFELNKKIDNLIVDLESNKTLEKENLILLNDYFININRIRNIRKFKLPIEYEINTKLIKNNNLFRYLFSGFILFFWISYVLLDDFKKTE